jgi:hypothetical protein
MKKIIFIGLMIAMSGLALTSCDDQNKGLEPDKVYLSRRGVVIESTYSLGEPVKVSLWANKSGIKKSAVRITYLIDGNLLTQLAADNPEQTCRLLPANCYTLPSNMTFDLAPGDEYAKFEFTYDPAAIMAESQGVYQEDLLALPIRIKVEGNGVDITDEMDNGDYAILVFDVMKPVINITNTMLPDLNVTLGETGMANYVLPVGIDFVSKWNINFMLETDSATLAAAVDAYNSANGTAMKLLPPSSLYINSETAVLSEGGTEAGLSFNIDKEKVQVGGALLPLILTGVSSPLYVGNDSIAFLTVRGMANRLPRAGWMATSHTFHPGNEADKVLDGLEGGDIDFNIGNYYHVAWKGEYNGFADDDPYVIINMGEKKTVAQVEIFPRYQGMQRFTPTDANNTANDAVVAALNILGYEIHTSDDGALWTKQSNTYTCPATQKSLVIDLYNSVETQYVKVYLITPGRNDPTNKNVANTVALVELYVRGF